MRFQMPVFQPIGSVLSAQGNGVGMFIGPEGPFTVPRSQHLCEAVSCTWARLNGPFQVRIVGDAVIPRALPWAG